MKFIQNQEIRIHICFGYISASESILSSIDNFAYYYDYSDESSLVKVVESSQRCVCNI